MAIVDIAYEKWQKDFEAECPDIFKEGSLTGPGTALRRDLMRTAYMAGKKAAPQPVRAAEQLDRVLDEAIDQRDHYHEVADDLASHIERITGVEIGEHSSDNCPWQNAMEAAECYSPAQGIDLGQLSVQHVTALRDMREHMAAGTLSLNDWRGFGTAALDAVLALIDQRDAAPGVG